MDEIDEALESAGKPRELSEADKTAQSGGSASEAVAMAQVSAAPMPPPPPAVVAATAPILVVGKTRNPWGVFLLALIPFYSLYWYYQVNREMRDYSSTIDVQPGLSVLAVTLGAFTLIIPIISWCKTCGRVQRAQKLAGSTNRCSAILSILCLWFGIVYVQTNVNKIWDQYGNPADGTQIR